MTRRPAASAQCREPPHHKVASVLGWLIAAAILAYGGSEIIIRREEAHMQSGTGLGSAVGDGPSGV